MNRLKGILKKNNGTTLVEVLLSVALLAIIVTPFLDTLYLSVRNNVASKEKMEAVAISEETIEKIKSRAFITEENDDFNVSGSGLNVAYSISSVSTIGAVTAPGSTVIPISTSGAIISSGINTYDISRQKEVNNSEFELIIDQGNVPGKISSINLEAYNIDSTSRNKSLNQPTPIPDLAYATEYIVFNVTQAGVTLDPVLGNKYEYKYSFGKKGDILSTGTISSTNNIARLKVSYANDISSSVKQLNLITDDTYDIYVVNDKVEDSGINIINYNDLNLYYIDLPVFNPSAAVNGLFKISITVKKNGSPIYSTTSYVKK